MQRPYNGVLSFLMFEGEIANLHGLAFDSEPVELQGSEQDVGRQAQSNLRLSHISYLARAIRSILSSSHSSLSRVVGLV